jgi:Domain of unknown function (DUF3291)
VTGWHLAQFNVARLHQPLDHPDTAAFVDALGEINEVAEASPGFVWRLQDEEGQSSSYVVVYDDPLLIVNYSIWERVEHLRQFVYQSAHSSFLRRRRQWFSRMAAAYLVCWWVPAGTIPSVEEAAARLEQLRREGPGEVVFTLHDPRPAPSTISAG